MSAETLSESSIVEAGERLVRRSGWAALSLRSVADELGVTPMALYRHVGNSESMKSAIVESVLGRMARPADCGDAAKDLMSWARSAHEYLSTYPGVSAHLLTTWFESPILLEQIDDLLGIAEHKGIEGFDAVATVNAVFMYVLMRCEAERVVRDAGVVHRSLLTAAAAGPLLRLNSLSKHFETAEFNAHFEFGLAALVSGMRLARTVRPKRAQ